MNEFKQQVQQDNADVFMNLDEFAEVKRVIYADFDAAIPVILDHEITQHRRIGKDGTQTSNDHAPGINLGDVRAYINEKDLGGVIPRQGKRIKFGTREYKIVKVSLEMGEIILDLEVYGE